MGQLVAAAGQVIGYAVGGPLGAIVGGAIGGAVGGALFPQKVQGPRLGDLRVTGTEYGQCIPWVAGAPRIAGQIAWASSKREIANTQKVGKGGSQKVTSFTYEVDLLILLTENEIDGISRIWSNGELVYNGTTTKEGVWSGITIYTGTADQLPDPIYEADVGAGNAPAYRGHAYVVIQGLQLGNSGQIPNLTFEVRESSATIDDRIRLLTSFNDETSTDQSIYQIGAGSQNNGVINAGAFRCDFNLAASNTLSWTDAGLDGVNNAPVTYEVLMKVVRNNSLSEINLVEFKKGSPSSPDNVLSVSMAASSVGGELTIIETGLGLGLSSPIAFTDSVNATTRESIHIALVVYPDDTASLFYCGNRVKNRVVFDTASSSSQGKVLIGGVESVTRDAIIDFYAVRVARAEVYTSATYTIPEDLTGNLSNTEVSFGEFEKPLYEVVDLLMARAGYVESDWDTSQLFTQNKTVKGLTISQVVPTRSVLEQLQTAYFFETAKSDKIYFFPRSSSSIATVPFDDLRATSDPDSKEEPLALQTANELEIPAQIALTYPNVLGDYNAATEFSDRIETAQQSTQTLALPIGFTPSEAKGIVDALVLDQVANLTTATVKLPLEYAYIEPGDVMTLTNDDGRQYRMRVQQKTDELLTHVLDCRLDDVGALTSAEITDGGYVLTEDVRQLADTLWESLDIPLLQDADNVAGFYVAVAPEPSTDDTDWPGAVFARAFTAENYRNEFITGESAVLGACQTTLGNWTGGNVFDESNSVTVRVTGQLESTTRAEMLDDLSINMCLVGNELIRFRFATFVQTVAGYNEYKLTSLIRGQRGTEQYQTGHTASERFVLLNGKLRTITDQNSQIDVASTVKAVTLNLLLSDVTGEAFTNTAVRLKPLSVANLRALADGSDLDITWQRRTRVSYRYGGTIGVSVPLGEATEAYRVRIYDGSTLVRTEDVTTTSYTYLAADIASDGFSSGATATIEVVQLSEIVGEGFPAETEGVIP